jgi:hypothetical protein
MSEVVIQIYIFNLKPGFLWQGFFADNNSLNSIPCIVAGGWEMRNIGIRNGINTVNLG